MSNPSSFLSTKKGQFIAAGIAIAVISVVVIIIWKKEKFDITTDPLRSSYSYETENCSPYPVAKRNGLNTETDHNIDICHFNELYNKNTVFVENVNTDPYVLPARQLCAVLYANHQEYFTNMWSGLGECEVYQTQEVKKCPKQIKIDKHSTYYPTVPNL